jgi:hypothetical protein
MLLGTRKEDAALFVRLAIRSAQRGRARLFSDDSRQKRARPLFFHVVAALSPTCSFAFAGEFMEKIAGSR